MIHVNNKKAATMKRERKKKGVRNRFQRFLRLIPIIHASGFLKNPSRVVSWQKNIIMWSIPGLINEGEFPDCSLSDQGVREQSGTDGE